MGHTTDFFQAEGGLYDKRGSVVAEQSAQVSFASSGVEDTGIFLPANAKIIDVRVFVKTGATAATNLSIGHTNGAEFLANFAVGTADDKVLSPLVSGVGSASDMADVGASLIDSQEADGSVEVKTKASRADNDADVILTIVYSHKAL